MSPEKAFSQESSSKVTSSSPPYPTPDLLSFPLLAAMKVVNATPEKDTLSLNKEENIYPKRTARTNQHNPAGCKTVTGLYFQYYSSKQKH